MTKRFVASYTVKGQIQNFNNSKFYVEILDNDQHWFDDRIDDLLGSSWTDDSGKFEIIFTDDLYRDNWLEGKPELFVVVRDESGTICNTTNTKSPSSPDDVENLEQVKKLFLLCHHKKSERHQFIGTLPETINSVVYWQRAIR